MYVLDTVWEDVALGGQEELQRLTIFVRDPGVALKMLRTWRTTQKRGQYVGIPALGGNERLILLVKMISKLEKKHSQFCHRVGT
eukprot:8852104-Prorocentrum_lima.AAC.1